MPLAATQHVLEDRMQDRGEFTQDVGRQVVVSEVRGDAALEVCRSSTILAPSCWSRFDC